MGGQYARIIGLIRGMHRGFCTLVLFIIQVYSTGIVTHGSTGILLYNMVILVLLHMVILVLYITQYYCSTGIVTQV